MTTTADPVLAEHAVDAVAGAEDAGLPGLEVLGAALRALTQGRNMARAGVSLSGEALRILSGNSAVTAEKGDWRFADPTWEDHPGYRRLKQLYLAWSQALMELVEDADLDWRARERARFALNVVTSAVAPTNFFWGNPAAIKRAIETGGGSVVTGLRQFLSDVRHNGGMPTQVDASGFRVGENVAVTPGAVVYRNDVCEVLQFAPSTPTVRTRPVVMVPPQINKYYFMDLAPGRSFVEYAVSRGIPFFAVSWRNPRPEHGAWNLDTYVGAVLDAIDVAREITGSDDVNVKGLCAGGITASAALAHLAATGDSRINAVSYGVTLLDWDTPAMVGVFRSRPLLSLARGRSARAGVLDGRTLGSVFTWMRPNDLVWNYWVNNYLLGKRPPAFDILAWNADQTNLPAGLHAQFLELFERNSLAKPGAISALGTPIDLSRIKSDTYVTGGLTDHLTPWEGCYRTTQLLGGNSTFVLTHTGHIQTMVNPPGNPKAYYYTGPEPGPDPHEWRSRSEKRPGSWWEHWAEWILARSGDERPAPSKLGSKRHPVIEPAPGRYVLDKG
jgi:polyhydroxyalkanoate synthase